MDGPWLNEEIAKQGRLLPGETTLAHLPSGALFETRNGIRAIKSEYWQANGQYECILLESGEYAQFPEGNSVAVRQLDVIAVRPPEPDNGVDLERAVQERTEAIHRRLKESHEYSYLLEQRIVVLQAALHYIAAVRHCETCARVAVDAITESEAVRH